MLEKEIEKAVCDYAKTKGFECYKFSSPNRVGVPDRMFILPVGQLFFIEFKKEGGKPTPMQSREALRIVNCGFRVYLIDNVEEGKEIIDHHKSLSDIMCEALGLFHNDGATH